MRKSFVWAYFHENAEKTQAICRICNQKLTRSGSKSTSNLRKHIMVQHPEEANSMLQLNLDSIIDTSDLDPGTGNAKKPRLNELETKNWTTDGTDILDLLSQPTTKTESTTVPHSKAFLKYFQTTKGCMDAVCVLCSKTVKFYGNSNLRKHLKSTHKAEADEVGITADFKGTRKPSGRPPGRPPGSGKSSGSGKSAGSGRPPGRPPGRPSGIPKPYSGAQVTAQRKTLIPGGTRKKLLDERVVSLIVSDCLPISFVESKKFKDLMSLADPHYSLPSKNILTTELMPQIYHQTIEKVSQRLEGVSYIALSTEMWSPRDNEICLSLTAHFIPLSDWTLQSALLCTSTFIGSPMGNEISHRLQNIVTEWKISEKVTVMVADNETYSRLANEQLPWAYVPCFGHLIHLVVTDAIPGDEKAIALIEKVRSIVILFQQNPQVVENFTVTQKSLGLPENKLILNVAVRWNSIYFMLERMAEQVDAVNAVLENNYLAEKCLTDEDRAMMSMIMSSLKPFILATKSLSLDKTNSVSVVMPLVKGLSRKMDSLVDGREILVKNLKDGLISSFGKMEDIEWIVTATLLDPRFKKFPFAEAEAIQRAKEIILAEVSTIVGAEVKKDTVGNSVGSPSNPSQEDLFWDFLDTGKPSCSNSQERKHIPAAINREVHCYLESEPIQRNEDPLFYWKQHQEMFPNLHKVALKYITMPVTSMPFERFFSKTGVDLMDKKSRVKAKHAKMFFFLKENM